MGKIKVIFFLIVLSFCFNTAKSYEISDLIKILIEKNNTDSAFKYNDLIDDKKTSKCRYYLHSTNRLLL
jgi:hypothetical protein